MGSERDPVCRWSDIKSLSAPTVSARPDSARQRALSGPPSVIYTPNLDPNQNVSDGGLVSFGSVKEIWPPVLFARRTKLVHKCVWVCLYVRACLCVWVRVCVWVCVRAKESEGDGRVGGMRGPARI